MDFSSIAVRFRKWGIIFGGLLLILMTAALIAKGPIIRKIEASVLERLDARGLKAEWSDVSWSLLRGGARFEKFVLREADGEMRPVIQADSISVSIPPWDWIRPGGSHATLWKTRHSHVVLTDADGSVTLEDVSASIEAHRGEILIKRAKARAGGLAVDLEGKILTRKQPLRPPPKFVLKLKAVRGTLAALDFDGGGKPFRVTGSFEVDASSAPPFAWKADLKGDGRDVIWKSVPFEKAGAEAELSSGDSRINAGVSTAHGKAAAVITRQGWKGTPFVFEGTLEDEGKRSDQFKGTYGSQTLEVGSLEGNADLWAIAGDIPMLANGRSEALQFRKFPRVEARDVRWSREDGFSVGGIELKEKGEAVVKREGREIELRNLSGHAAYGGKQWLLENVSADLFGGGVSVSGHYGDGRLSKAKVRAENLKLSEIKRSLGKKAPESAGLLSLDYSGAAHFRNRDFDGGGSMRLENAPVIEVPLLDEVHDLFAALIPGVERSKEGRFDADFTARSNVVSFRNFKATGGTLVVDAEGDVDLKKETVSGTARGRLTGLPGVVTSPVSRLLEMEVGGTIDRIRVKPLGPGKIISNAATGAAGVVEDIFKGTGEAGGSLRGKSPKSPKHWFDNWKR